MSICLLCGDVDRQQAKEVTARGEEVVMSCIGFSWIGASAAVGSYSANPQSTGPRRKARTRPTTTTPIQSVKKKVSRARLVRQALSTRDSRNAEEKSSPRSGVDSDSETSSTGVCDTHTESIEKVGVVKQEIAPSTQAEPPPSSSKSRLNRTPRTTGVRDTHTESLEKVGVVKQEIVPSTQAEPPPSISKSRSNRTPRKRINRKAEEISTAQESSDGESEPLASGRARANKTPRKRINRKAEEISTAQSSDSESEPLTSGRARAKPRSLRTRKPRNAPVSMVEPPPPPPPPPHPEQFDGQPAASKERSPKAGLEGNGSDIEMKAALAVSNSSDKAGQSRKVKKKRRARTSLSSMSIPFNEQKKQLPEEERVRLKPRNRRARSYAPSSNRTFSAYMDEITASGLLEQREVVRLSAEIRAGVAIEEKQRKLASKLKRNASLHEVAEELNVTVDHVRQSLLRGKAAKNRMVSSNLRLVTSVCRRMSSSRSRKVTMDGSGGSRSVGTGLSLDDMIQEGSMGLIRAAEKFDGSRGYKFSTYATWWIKAAVMRGITSQSRSIRVPSTIVDEYNRIRKEYERLRTLGQRNASEEQVAETLGMTAGKLRFVVQSVMRTTASLDLNVGSTDGTGSKTLVELIEGDDNVEERMVEEMQKKELDGALKLALVPIERVIIRLRFGLDDGHPRTLDEIGRMVGISKERVRQIVFKSLGKLNTAEMRERLDAYLGS